MPESAALEFAPEMRQRWAWSADDMRHFGHLVVDLIAHHLTSLPRRGQAFLSSTTLDGTFVLRACIINPRTQPGDLEYLVAMVRELGAQVAGGGM